jgi:hypothetical protein
MIVAATFHGPEHDKPNHDESSIEVFDNLGEVITTLFERHLTYGARPLPIRFLSGAHGNIPFLGIEPGHYFKCWVLDSMTLPPIEQDPDEGTILDVLTTVHLGSPDYRYTLVSPNQVSVWVRG